MKKLLSLAVSSPCSRRTLLRGLGAASALVVVRGVTGCTSPSSNLPTGSTTTASCAASGVCVDLTDKANAPLANAGGALLVDALGDTIMLIRTSASDVVALSALCTHQGCSMDFDSSRSLVTCPCHGSEFSEAGAVVQGPATRPLKVYTATLANQMLTITA